MARRMVFSRRGAGLALALLALSTSALPGAAALAWNPLAREPDREPAPGATGSSYVAVDGACVPAVRLACQGMTTWRDGAFGVPAAGRVRIVATWQAACLGCTEMKVHVDGVASKTGASPLTLDLGVVPAGTYAVGVFFGGPVAGKARQDVSWTVLRE